MIEALPPIFTSETAAQALGCSARTVEDYARRGQIPGMLFGDGGWVFVASVFIDAVARLTLEEAERRKAEKTQPTPVGVQVEEAQPKGKGKGKARSLPGMGHLSPDQVNQILSKPSTVSTPPLTKGAPA
jgi:hypothetical protein